MKYSPVKEKRTILDLDIATLLFYLSYTVALSYSLLGHIRVIGDMLQPFQIASYILLFMCFILKIKQYDYVEITRLAALALLGAIISINTHDNSVIKLVLVIAAFRGLDFRFTIKFDIAIRLTLIVLVYHLYTIGVATDIIAWYDGNMRHSYGFTNPNTLALAITILSLEMLYLNGFKFNTLSFSILLFAFGLISSVTASRTSEIIIIVACIVCVVNTYSPGFFMSKIVVDCIGIAPVIFTFVVILTCIAYLQGNNYAIYLNEMLSNRIENITYHYQLSGIHLFGSDLNENNRTLDTLYAYLAINQGLLAIFAFLITFPVLLRTVHIMGDIPLIIALLCLTIYGISERLWFSVDYDIIVVFYSFIILKYRTDRNSLNKISMVEVFLRNQIRN